jgi:radical SAM protein (TIGR01212 family)
MGSFSATPAVPSWRASGLRYYTLGHFFRERFGGRVWKVSIDAGFGCPNRDGTLDTAGCIFCDPASFSPSRRLALLPIPQQIDRAIQRLARRGPVDRVIAYFQPGTNTYASLATLRRCYDDALGHPRVVGLAIGTRPDSLPEETLDLLATLADRASVVVELGLQSIHDETLRRLNRHHDGQAFFDAVARLHRRGLPVCAHVILGLPGETTEQMRATAQALARLKLHAVKIHNLHAVHGTPLAAMVERGEVRLPELDEFVRWTVDFLELLPEDCVIERLGGDAPPQYLLAPTWCLNKAALLRRIDAEFRHRQSWQGRRCENRSGTVGNLTEENPLCPGES